ncbi:hypothetical protein HX109_04360 [Galbibacter sp. BG1]|uniref:GyrI-like domain-containing protein n=1 Tax=Galbibacter sp. BG1 TaxID=1170699 RepID=UPI0015B9C203|nr:GyrI-like domain-containing protein [Galbibacter sp. BG1]QLE00835.1 hypothetical protein HX109_04360 [Galbibacter sp. BG1]
MKKIIGFLALLLIVALSWYLFIKKSDYIYQFKEKASTGTIFYSITNWQKTKDSVRTTTIDSTLYSQIVQKVNYKGEDYTVYWDIDIINDSISEISAGVKQDKNSLKNRLTAPFTQTDFTSNTRNLLIDFKKVLDLNLSTFRVNEITDTISPAKKCACVNAETSPEGKAKQMMRNYNYISSYIANNNIQEDGRPLVVINEFNKAKNRINMDFCFPIKGLNKLPGTPGDIFYKVVEAKPSIKTVFNGNYMYSHHAWYSLYDYAENNDMNIGGEIVEQFHNNPNLGGDALRWKTDVYIPIN